MPETDAEKYARLLVIVMNTSESILRGILRGIRMRILNYLGGFEEVIGALPVKRISSKAKNNSLKKKSKTNRCVDNSLD